jgi:hypothetical protein
MLYRVGLHHKSADEAESMNAIKSFARARHCETVIKRAYPAE